MKNKLFMLQSFMIIGVLFFSAKGFADPVITDVAGNLEHGQSLTISGSGFGVKDPVAPLKYDDFELGTVGETLPDQAHGGWYRNGDGWIPQYSIARQRIPGEQVAEQRFYSPQDGGGGYGQPIGLTNIPFRKIYASIWIYRDDFEGTALNTVNAKVWGHFYRTFNLTPQRRAGYLNGNCYLYIDDYNYGSAGSTGASGAEFQYELNKWTRVEEYMDSGTVGNYDAHTWIAHDFQPPFMRLDNVRALVNDYQFSQFQFSHYFGLDNGASIKQYWGEAYVDITQARIELGNAPVFEQATHREIQIPHTTWNSDTIQFTANLGSFGGNEPLYLFVIDENGNVSAGYPVSTEGEGCEIVISASDTFPYTLNQSGQTYCVAEDIVTAGSAFVVAANNVTLDLQDHSVTWGDAGYVEVANGGFEDGAGAIPTDWDLSSTAGRAARTAKEKFWGDYELKFTNLIASDGTLSVKSATFALNANTEYTTWLNTAAPVGNTGSVQLFLVNAADDLVLASSSVRNVNGPSNALNAVNINGMYSSPTGYTPSSDVTAYLRIDVSTTAIMGQTIYIDGVDVRQRSVYGVKDTTGSYSGLTITTPTENGGGFIQGAGKQATSYGVYSRNTAVTGASTTIQNIYSVVNGAHTVGIFVRGYDLTVSHTHITSTATTSIWRMEWRPLLFAEYAFHNLSLTNNVLSGGYHMGIGVYTSNARIGDGTVLIDGNSIRHQQIYTDGYGIATRGLKNATISNNTIDPQAPYYGRGLIIDTTGGSANDHSTADNLHITGNTIVNIQELPNAEFGASALEAPAIRLRGYTHDYEQIKNVEVDHNTITSFAGTDKTQYTNALFLTLNNAGDSVLIHDNNISAISDNDTARADCLGLMGVASGALVRIYDNTLVSNSSIVWFSGIDFRDTNGVLLDGNVATQLSPRENYHSIIYGYWNSKDINNAIYGLTDSGDPDDICWNTNGDQGDSDLTIGWQLTASVTRNSVPMAGVTVTATDALMNAYTGVTGDDGAVTLNLPEYRLTGAGDSCPDLSTLSRTDYAPYFVSVSGTEDQIFSGTSNGTLYFEIGNNPPILASIGPVHG